METRPIGRTGRTASVIGLGCWQLGADWGEVSEDAAMEVLRAAVDNGVTFLDTADVYGDGRSERLVGQLLSERRGLAADGSPLTVATKMGRRADPLVPEAFTLDAFRAWTDRSRANLGVDTLDLVQLHCPPTPVYSDPSVYEALETLVEERRIAAYGVSVETCDEALTAMAHPNLTSVQIILNAFRRKPLDRVLPLAVERSIAIIARVPLASGLLAGRYTRATTFAADDHRTYNRSGSAFDVGETFAGVPFEVGVEAADRINTLVADTTAADVTTAQFALRWLIDQPGVTTVIPGARSPEQAVANARSAEVQTLTPGQLATVRGVYDELIAPHVADRW